MDDSNLMINALARLRLLLAVAVIATIGLRGGVPSILADWRLLDARLERDFVSRETDRYPVLVPSLPPIGFIGYLPNRSRRTTRFCNCASPRTSSRQGSSSQAQGRTTSSQGPKP